MNRTHFHEHIAILTEKIAFLNRRLSNEEKIHPVETELLQGYARELLHIAGELAGYKPDAGRPSEQQAEASARRDTVEKKSVPEAEPEPAPPAGESLETTSAEVIAVNEAAVAEPPPQKEAADAQEKSLVKDTAINRVSATLRATAKERKILLNDKFRKEAAPLAEKLKDVKKKNLKELFDINERYSLIEKLFGGSPEQFRKAMNDLSKCTSREEAEAYIKIAEVKYSWRDKKNEALALSFTRQVLGFLSPQHPS